MMKVDGIEHPVAIYSAKYYGDDIFTILILRLRIQAS